MAFSCVSNNSNHPPALRAVARPCLTCPLAALRSSGSITERRRELVERDKEDICNTGMRSMVRGGMREEQGEGRDGRGTR